MLAFVFGLICGVVILSLWQHIVKRGKKRTVRKGVDAKIIYIDESLKESIRYDWRTEKSN